MRTRLQILMVPLFFVMAASDAKEFAVTKGGKSTKLGKSDLAKLKVQTITVTDPNESKPEKPVSISYKAYDGREFLDLAFGGRSGWDKSKQLKFTCADGYQPSLDTKDLLDGEFFMAFAREGSKKFEVVNNLKDGKKVDAGPYYVIWTKKENQTKERAFYWPYQLVSVSVVE